MRNFACILIPLSYQLTVLSRGNVRESFDRYPQKLSEMVLWYFFRIPLTKTRNESRKTGGTRAWNTGAGGGGGEGGQLREFSIGKKSEQMFVVPEASWILRTLPNFSTVVDDLSDDVRTWIRFFLPLGLKKLFFLSSFCEIEKVESREMVIKQFSLRRDPGLLSDSWI